MHIILNIFVAFGEKDILKSVKSENGTFPLLYVMKMTLIRGVRGLKAPLYNINVPSKHMHDAMAPEFTHTL